MYDLILILAKNGFMAVILAVVMWDNWKMKKKLFQVIENNTAAFIALQTTIKERRRRYDND